MSLIDRVQTNEELSRRCHRTCSHVPFATEFSFFTAAPSQVSALRAVVCAATVRATPFTIDVL